MRRCFGSKGRRPALRSRSIATPDIATLIRIAALNWPWPRRSAMSAAPGGRPLAITNCLNFRNPEKPAGYFQLSRAMAGHGGCLPGARSGRRQR